MTELEEGLSFDDVLIKPGFSDFLPDNTDMSVKLSNNLELKIPIFSAAMDTVTEYVMAIAMALSGGIGVIHKNLSIEEQADQVSKVKSYDIKSIGGKEDSQDYYVANKAGDGVITLGKEEDESRVDCSYPSDFCLDSNNKLVVAAAIGAGIDEIERASALIKAGVDILVIDSAHGASKRVVDTISAVKKLLNKDMLIIAGNVVCAEHAKILVEAGANVIKVGIGPGSICTTRLVTGVGFPQWSAVRGVCDFCNKIDIPVIADGGIRFSGDIAKSIGAGASCVMLGSMLAGSDESPGDIVEDESGVRYKNYRGMGSVAAMKQGSSSRYGQEGRKLMISEGVEATVPYKGSVSNILSVMVGGLRSSMVYTGNNNIKDFQSNTNFVRITSGGVRESHVHDLKSFKDSHNYKK